MNEIKNTLISGANSKKLVDLDTKKIIRKYIDNYAFDASRFFVGLENIQIYECELTGFRYYYPLTVEGDDSFYTVLYTKHHAALYSKTKWEFEVALNSITGNSKVLDIGSGGGDFLNLLKSKNNTQLFALEKSSYAHELLKEKGINIVPMNLNDYANTTEDRYDVVTAFQVLEHVGQPGEFLKNAVRLLKPGGKLIIGVPNSNPYLYKNDVYHTLNLPPHHMGLWDKEALQKLSSHFNLNCEKILIEPLDNVLYLLMSRLNLSDLYLSMQKNKLSYFILKCIKYPLQLFKSLFKGRGLLAIYVKKS